MSIPQGVMRQEGLGKLKKCIHFMGSRTRHLLTFNTVAQPTTIPCATLLCNSRPKNNQILEKRFLLLLLRQYTGLMYQPLMMDGDGCEAINGMNEWQGKSKYSELTCPSVALSTTNPT
jgi:hypothetical protein